VRLGDTLRVSIRVTDVGASKATPASPQQTFLQMRGIWTAVGTAAGRAIADSGTGFFETWLDTRK
jgi:hypothetical protein